MSFSIQVTGMEELLQKMDQLPGKAEGVAAEALYEGAGVMADAVSRAVHGIATEPFKYAAGGRQRKPSPEEKAILMSARKGIAKFRKDGISVQTSVGMQNSGYAELAGRIKPIPLIANSIESGTSFMKKQPFFRKAVTKAKGATVQAIENGIKSREKELSID